MLSSSLSSLSKILNSLIPLLSDLKILARQISHIKHQISKTKTQILYNLFVLFPEAEKHLNIFSKSFLNILLHFPSAKHIAKAPSLKLKRIILASSKRPPTFSHKSIKSLAKSSIGISHKGFESSLKFLIKQLFFLENQVKNLEKTLEDEISKTSEKQINILSSIKGISKKLGSFFLAEIENIKKFANAKKLIKYAGTDPVVKQSGKWQTKRGISKQGNPFLRYILYQMATGVITWNKIFKAYYKIKFTQFKSHKKAMIAVINKLTRVIFAILKNNSFFNPSYHKNLYPNFYL